MWNTLKQFFSVITKLTEIQLSQARTERLLADLGNQLTANDRKVELIMTTLTELKDLAAKAFQENSDSLTLALTRIDELKARLPNPEDGAIADTIAEGLRAQIAANDDFQAKLNPAAPAEG